jgi:hypothetical protein
MANRFPLIINSSLSQIQELASGDGLDLSGSDISNVGNVNVATVATIATGNITTINSTLATITTGNIANINSTLAIITTGNIANINSTTGNIANVNLVKFGETVVAGGSTGAATITPNAAAGTIYNYTLTGNITLSALTNAVAGTSMTIILTQDATGSRTLTSTMKFSGASKTLSTSANAIDIMSVFYDGTTYYATLSKGYA